MDQITYLIMSMQAKIHKQLMKGLAQTELSTGQPKVLAFLKSHEGLCQRDVAQACLMEPSSLTVLLNRMEQQGMIERRYQGGNRKTRYIYLTEYGKDLAAQVVDRFYEVERKALAGIPEEEKETFFRVCRGIVNNLGTEEPE